MARRGRRGNKGNKGNKGGGATQTTTKGMPSYLKDAPSYVQQAYQMVLPSYMPQIQAINRTTKQGVRQYKKLAATQAEIYPALQTELKNIGEWYQTQTAPLAGQLADTLSTLPGTMSGNIGVTPDAERAAGMGMLGAIGSAAESNLTSERMRNIGYNASTRRQGAVEQATLARNAVTDLKNFLEDMRNQKLDVRAQIPAAVMAAAQQIKQQMFNNHLAMLNYDLSARQLSDQERAQAAAEKAAHDLNMLIYHQFYDDESVDETVSSITDPTYGAGGTDNPIYEPGTGQGSGSGGGVGGQGAGMNQPSGTPQAGLNAKASTSAAGQWVKWVHTRTQGEVQQAATQLVDWLLQRNLHARIHPNGTVSLWGLNMIDAPGDVLYVLQQFNTKVKGGV